MKKGNLFLFLVLAFVISACSGFESGGKQEDQYAPTLNAINTQASITAENAIVIESLQVSYLDTSPVTVLATVKGYLPDSCMVLDRINVEQKVKLFELTLITHLQTDGNCEQERQEFEEEVLLPIEELPADIYGVRAGEHIVRFSIEAEDGSAEPGSG